MKKYTNFTSDIFANMREEARKHIREYLEDYEGYLCDFHAYAFNSGYYCPYDTQAEAAINENGGYTAIQHIIEYEQGNFGEVYTDFSKPTQVASALWYIIGEDELCDVFKGCEEYDVLWNEEITEIEAKALLAWAIREERL